MLDDFRDDEVNTSGEFLDEFRQRLNSQPLENIDERRATVGRSQQIFLSALLGVSLAGAVSWFIFSPDYAQVENIEIPVVRRPQTAVKMQPADPGGMEILNQDKTVYDIVEKKDAEDAKIESLLPPPEEPAMPIVQIKDKVEEVNVAETAEKILHSKDKNSEAADTVVEVVKQDIEEVKQVENKVSPVEESEPDNIVKEDKIEIVKVIEEKKVEQPKVVEEKPVVQPKAANAEKKRTIPAGVWQVQLISSPNEAAVDKAWKNLKMKYSMLKDLPHEVETADLGAKGVFYRLKVGSFVDRGDADKLCNSIKNSGGTCLVKKK